MNKKYITLVIVLIAVLVTIGTTPIPNGSPTHMPICTSYKQNTFYPGINWKEGDPNLNLMANCLDSTLRESYANTGIIDGAINTWLASKDIATQQNYLSTNEGDGHYTIAFSHSGGTQTLIKKIEEGNVTADYVVLAAPALLEQQQLVKLIKEGKIRKKVIILQSERDILYRLKVQQKLFENQDVNGDGKDDIITFTEEFPEIKEALVDSIDVHGALRDKMVIMFVNGKYPFDGSFEGLKKKG
jgi:hypothetical protein